jgi:hypothetical protein
MDLDKYKTEAEKFLSEIDKEYYLHFSGKKDSLNLTRIYNRYESLFSSDNFNKIKELKEKSNGEEKKKYSFLLKFCGEGLIERQVKELVDAIAGDEAKATIEIEGREVPYRYSQILLANEENKVKRDLIDDKRSKKVEEQFNDKLCQYWEALHNQAKNLGFSSYKDLFSFLKDEDFLKLKSGMELLLEKTQEIYEQNFGYLLLKETNVKLTNSRRSDFDYLERANKYDKFFKKDSLVELFKDTLFGMGIDLEKQSNIILDVGERKNKDPRAFCCTVRIPDEIYLVVMPKGGQDDFEAMFHEGGHAEHFSNTRAALDFEYKFLGDCAVTEGYAFSIEHLMHNREWLTYFLKMSPGDAWDFLHFLSVKKLWFCRRFAGKLKYEIILHDAGPISGKDEIYREILTSVNLMQYSRVNYLKDVDEGFYCTDYIRAWIFESQLKDYIHTKFGYGWFKQKKAGDFLKELWSYGQKYNTAEILEQLDFEGLDVNYLIDSLTTEIKKYRERI